MLLEEQLGRLELGLDKVYGPLVDCRHRKSIVDLPSAGDHGHREEVIIGLLVTQGAAASELVLIDNPVHVQLTSKQVSHDDSHCLKLLLLLRADQFSIQQRLQYTEVAVLIAAKLPAQIYAGQVIETGSLLPHVLLIHIA